MLLLSLHVANLLEFIYEFFLALMPLFRPGILVPGQKLEVLPEHFHIRNGGGAIVTTGVLSV